MLALVSEGGRVELATRRPPTLEAGTALVRVTRAGICNTDLELVRGYMSFHGVLGHEFVGTVTRGPEEWIGQRVVAEINFACRACDTCNRGLYRHCPTRRVMGILHADGAFAEFVAVPVENLHAVPATITDDEAVFAEPLAAACEVLEQVHVRPGMSCTVIGDGKLGLLVAQVLHQAGAQVLAVGHHRHNLDLLRSFGIDTVLRESWRQERTEMVVEASGSSAAFADAVRATVPRGILVLKSTVADAVNVHLAPLVIDEIQVIGSRCGSFPPALRSLAAGSVQVRALIAARFPLERGVEAMRVAAARGTLKVLLDIGAAEV